LALETIALGNPNLRALPTDRGHTSRPIPMISKAHTIWQMLTTKGEYVFDYGMPRWLVKTNRLLESMELDRLFIGRHKFYHFRRWYRYELAAFVREVLLDSRSLGRSFLDSSRIRRIVDEHMTGAENHTTTIHKLLSFELIHRNLIEKS
jgi:asparagine synthase (glutamine-hydrolysing)